jgi:hypothetical protein
MDRGFVEMFGPYGFATAIYKYSFNLSLVSFGFIFRSLFIILGGLGFFLILRGGWNVYLVELSYPFYAV